MEAAQKNEKLDEALGYLHVPTSWAQLYRAGEALMSIAEKEKRKGSKFERFVPAANHYRHHKDEVNHKLPEVPMDLREAEAFINNWLRQATDLVLSPIDAGKDG